jgi:hypothetical protein
VPPDSSPASGPLPSQVPPAEKVDTASTKSQVNDTSAASSEAAKQVAENPAPRTTPPPPEASRPSSSNDTSSGSGGNNPTPKPNTEEAAQTTPPAGQSAPALDDLVKGAPTQTPSSDAVRPTPSSPGRGKAVATYRPPVPLKQVLPRFNALPPGVADTVQQIKVLVRVDESGRVVEARILEGKNRVGSILGGAALTAARQWVFEPASLRGKTIASDHTILFQFRH